MVKVKGVIEEKNTMGEETEIMVADEQPYWETCTYTESNNIILCNLQTGQRAAIAIGYYLKHIRENKLYLDGGYHSFGDYVKAECGMSESTASRNIGRMEQFSEGGNSPRIASKWQDYGASQLQEIMYLTDEQREQVTPDMTVKEIREIRKPEPVEEIPVEVVICEEVELEPEIVYEPVVESEVPADTVIVESSVEEMLPDVDDPKIDFKALDRLISSTKDAQVDQEEVATSQEEVIKAPVFDCIYTDVVVECCPPMDHLCENTVDVCCEDCMEPWCPTRCKQARVPDGVELYENHTADEDIAEETPVPCTTEEITPQSILQDEKEKLEQWMEAFKDDPEVPEFIARQKIIVGALAGMVCDLKKVELPAPEQPELPIMRNNDQRKAFLDDHHSWPVWFTVPQADEIYYKYDFEDGSAFVIRETKHFNEWMLRYSAMGDTNYDPEGVHTQEYILKPNYRYLSNCRSNRSEMIDYLRKLQK